MQILASLLLILSQTLVALPQGQTTFGGVSYEANCIWNALPTGPQRVQFYQELSAILATGPVFSKHKILLVTAAPLESSVTPHVIFRGPTLVADFTYAFTASELNCVAREHAALVDLVALSNPAVDAVLTRYSVIVEVVADKVKIFPRAVPLPPPPISTMSTLGNSGIGVNGGTLAVDQFEIVGPFTVPQSGTATNIQFYGSSNGGRVTYGIYNDNAGVPGSLVSTSAEHAVSVSAEWQTIAITGNLVGGRSYWLGIRGGVANSTFYYDFGNPDGRYSVTSPYTPGVMPDPPPATVAFGNVRRSLYLNYTQP